MPRFKFRTIPFIATLFLVVLGSALSYWQTQRAHQKEAIEAILQAHQNSAPIALPDIVKLPEMEYTRVILRGQFLQNWALYLDNRPMNGASGMEVIMPFKLQNSNKVVLVVRGWIPRNLQNRAAVKTYQTPTEIIDIEGQITSTASRVYQLGTAPKIEPNAILQNVTINDFKAAFKNENDVIEPFWIMQTKANNLQPNAPNDGLQRDWTRASFGSEKHRGYAFQWLALAVMALLFFIVTGFKRDKHNSTISQND